MSGKQKKLFQRIFKRAEAAFNRLYKAKGYKPADLFNVPEYKALVEDTASLFSSTFSDNKIPPEMAAALEQDIFLFSGLKTHAQLFEASRMLTTENGTVKSKEEFKRDFNAVNTLYNQTYLDAEHQYAVAASQSVANWEAHPGGERYLLQYRTAGDERVRESHAALNLVTLPKEDPFWDHYYTPNGWRCRCGVQDVRAGKYPVSDSNAAIAAGDRATTQTGKDGRNRLAIFRFNPGKQKVLFPPDHPYHKVEGAKQAKAAVKKEKS